MAAPTARAEAASNDLFPVGGLNMAGKIAACSEFFNVRTARDGPGNSLPAKKPALPAMS